MLDQSAQHWLDNFRLILPLIITNALHLLAAILIIIVGFWVAGRTQSLVIRSLGRTAHLDAMLKTFFGNIIRYFVLTITLLAVLSQFGIETTSLVAVLGAAGLAIGLALQGTLSHLAAGVMLLIFRPFRIGHHVQVGGVDGTVKELSLFWTEIVTTDAVQVIIPNGSVWGQPLRNYSVYPGPPTTAEARIQLPNVDVVDTIKKIGVILQDVQAIKKDPAPAVLLDRNATSNNLEFVVTVVPADGVTPAVAKSAVIEAVHEAFEKPPVGASFERQGAQ
jgi:small conductance mechanosensitive channel